MWRPLQTAEIARAVRLLAKASSLLRQRSPYIDARMSRFAVDPTDQGGLDPVTVATVVATMVKRFLSNVEGIVTQTTGPYGVSYAIRGEKDIRGALQVTAADLDALRPFQSRKSRIGSIKTSPSLAPWPHGRIGGPPGSASATDLWLLELNDGPYSAELPVRGRPYGGG